MYIPNAFRETDHEKLVAFMRAHNFVTLVSVIESEPFASHVPVVVEATEHGVVLRGHLARANPHWRALDEGSALAIFTGPHAYVSASHYEQRESVPTWNYVAVHAYGPTKIRTGAEDAAIAAESLRALVAATEPGYQEQWDSLSERYRAGMLRGIVAFELTVTRLEGKYKLSQNRSHTDQQVVAAALRASTDAEERATGEMMAAMQIGREEPQ